MSVKYNVVERANPRDLEAPKKFYPSIQSSGRMDLRQHSKRFWQICTVSIPEELANGNIVDLGGSAASPENTGTVWLRSTSEGAEEGSNLLPRFNPGKEFKKALEGVKFVKSS